MPAPQTRAGVYDELEELEKLLDEYAHFEHNQPENLQQIESLINEKVQQADLSGEVAYDETKSFGEYAWRCIITSVI